MPASSYLANQILNHIFRDTAIFTPPTSVWLGLFTGDPGDTGSDNEVAAADYARLELDTASTFAAPSNKRVVNVGDVEFPEAVNDWGVLTHFALFDAETGNCLVSEELGLSDEVLAGETARFSAGKLSARVP